LRLGLVIYGQLDTLTGGYLYDRKLVEYLRRQGDRVEIVSLDWRDYWRHLGDNFSPALRRRILGLQADLLLQDELNHPSLFLLNDTLASRFRLVPIVHHLRSSERHPWALKILYRQVEKRFFRGVDACLYNSHTTQQSVEALTGRVFPGRVAYPAGDRLGPPLDEASIRARCREGGRRRLLFVGSLIPRKGLHDLLAALLRLGGAGWELYMAGRLDVDPAYTRRIQHQAARGGLAQQVHFLGPVPEDELARLYARSHLVVLPSSYEGFGIVILEAMSFGVPVLATTAGAAAEIIHPGVDGLLVPAGRPPALAEALAGVLPAPGELERLSLQARRRFGQFPRWEDSARAARQFLLRTLAGKETA
jgi:glycosyltransferase involved in cell wall biosynthesis